jgi:hypothetical protein
MPKVVTVAALNLGHVLRLRAVLGNMFLTVAVAASLWTSLFTFWHRFSAVASTMTLGMALGTLYHDLVAGLPLLFRTAFASMAHF